MGKGGPASGRPPEDRERSSAGQERPHLYLIDGSSYIFRAYHAIQTRLSNAAGLPTNAIFGFTQMLLKALREEGPTHCAVAFDLGESTQRHALYADYKANRPGMPEDLAAQWPYCRKVTEVLGVTILEEPGVEADDLIGTVARRAEAEGFRVTIITGDKDFFQLVSPRVRLWDTMRDRVIGEAEVRERFGVSSDRVVDVLGLMGDSIDNIPGVPGIGEKTARQLIEAHGDLDSLLAHLDQVKNPRHRQALLAHAEQARLSRELVTIDTQIPIESDPGRFRLRPIDREAALSLMKELEFSRFLAEIGPPEAKGPRKGYRTVLTEEEFQRLPSRLKASGGFAIDVETTHREPMWAELVGISVSLKEDEGFYIPLAHRYPGAPRQLSAETVLGGLKPLLEDLALPKYGQNIKYDLIVLKGAGVELQGVAFDTMVASYVLNPAKRSHNLEELSREFLDYQILTYSQVAGSGAKEKSFDQVDIETATRYSAEDADVTYQLVGLLGERLNEAGLRALFDEIEMPLVPVLAAMEQAGVRLDRRLLEEMGKELEVQMAQSLSRLYEYAGVEFNPNSPVQLREVLFDKLGLHRQAPPNTIRRTKTGLSTGAEILERLAPLHPLPAEILAYRQLEKLRSTYVEALPKLIHPRTGRIHTSFNQSVAATGRLSSSDPNLQNIPIRTDLGRRIRRAFVPKEGWRMLSADYSQVELRILAHFSQDERLLDAFRRGEDIHARTAREIFGLGPEAVTEERRRMAKAVNFGVIYGLSPFGLSQTLHVPVEEARRFIDGYFERYSGVKAYIEATLEEARRLGYVTTLRGRRRPIPDLMSPDRSARSFAERTAINTTIQGTAADIIKAAMIDIHRRLRSQSLKSDMLLQVHDELVFEGPPEEMETLSSLVREEMGGAASLQVPLVVETHVGLNWDEAH